jgi:hypothetical protein
MSKVFIVNYGGHDMTPAYKFTKNGDDDLVYITTGNINVFNTDRIIKEIVFKLRDFTPDDFLLFCGYGVLGALCFAHLMLRFSIVKTLIFNAKTREYIVRHVYRKEIFPDADTTQD